MKTSAVVTDEVRRAVEEARTLRTGRTREGREKLASMRRELATLDSSGAEAAEARARIKALIRRLDEEHTARVKALSTQKKERSRFRPYQATRNALVDRRVVRQAAAVTVPMPFIGGDTSGFSIDDTIEENVAGMAFGYLGWYGPWRDLGFMELQLPALTHTNDDNDEKVATATLLWRSAPLREGHYRLDAPWGCTIHGKIHLEGSGWLPPLVASARDAGITVRCFTVIKVGANTKVFDEDPLAEDDVDKSDHSESFHRTANMPDQLEFDAAENEAAELSIMLDVQSWAIDPGVARAFFYIFGILENLVPVPKLTRLGNRNDD